jgi:hypothetical protein
LTTTLSANGEPKNKWIATSNNPSWSLDIFCRVEGYIQDLDLVTIQFKLYLLNQANNTHFCGGLGAALKFTTCVSTVVNTSLLMIAITCFHVASAMGEAEDNLERISSMIGLTKLAVEPNHRLVLMEPGPGAQLLS